MTVQHGIFLLLFRSNECDVPTRGKEIYNNRPNEEMRTLLGCVTNKSGLISAPARGGIDALSGFARLVGGRGLVRRAARGRRRRLESRDRRRCGSGGAVGAAAGGALR